MTRYSEVMLALLIAKTKKVRHCPTPDCKFVYMIGKPPPDCKFVYMIGKNQSAFVVKCPSCEKKHCAGCGGVHPASVLCNDEKTKNLNEIKSMAFIKKTTKLCPQCKLPVDKDEACHHVTHKTTGLDPGCGYEFCWDCLGPWIKPLLHEKCSLVARQAAYNAWEDEMIKEHGFLGKIYVLSYDIFVGDYAWITYPVLAFGIGALVHYFAPLPEAPLMWVETEAEAYYNSHSFG